MNQLAQSMAAYKLRIIDALTRLCRIPSVKGESSPEFPFGQATADALEVFLQIGRELGFKAVNLDNRAGYVEYGTGKKLIAVLGHLDVVPVGDDWQTDPFEPVILRDRIIARGTADDKGPVIAALFALKALADEGFAPDARIRIIAGLDEESGSSCMEHYVQVDELPAAGFTPDSNFPVIYAEKGIAYIELKSTAAQPADAPLKLISAQAGLRPNMVPGTCTLVFASAAGEKPITFNGKPAHASTPWDGTNAISLAMQEAARLLQEAGCNHPFVDFYNQAISTSWRGEGLGLDGQDESGPLTLNAGLLTLDNQGASLTLDIRYPVTWPFERIEAAIQEKTKESCVTVHVVKTIEPLYMPADSKLVQTLMDTYNQLTGQQAKPMAIGGGTYARSMPNIVAFGPFFPGDVETAHQTGEYILMDTLMASAAIFREALRRLAD